MDYQHTNAGADVLASGIHDAKNRLFEAQTLLAQAELDQRVSLPDARFAITGAAARLSSTLVAYRLLRDQQAMSILPVRVAELVEDSVLAVRTQFDRAGITLGIGEGFEGDWPLDRTLCSDVVVNALQNACRHARSSVSLAAERCGEGLRICVNDDGPGFSREFFDAPPGERHGVGLFIADRIARMHCRKGRAGRLAVSNGGPLGGALFELFLP